MISPINRCLLLASFSAFFSGTCLAVEPARQVSRPDGKPADQTKKFKVSILMGQSNMVGMGDIEPEGTLTTLLRKDKRHPILVDDAGFEEATALLRRELDAGRTVVVDFKYIGQQYPGGFAGHTLSVCGYNSAENLDVLCNPAVATPGICYRNEVT